nr:CAZy families GT28 protein [uncultured Clostridium sp.]
MNSLEVRGLRVLSFTRQIPQLMAASDLFITKPGGLSISEAAACHLPLLCMDVVGGCELRNLDFSKRAIGLTAGRTRMNWPEQPSPG